MSEDKVCCNCKHNIRTGEVPHIQCHCDIDNHYIGYVDCMTYRCKRWVRTKKFDDVEKVSK